MNKNGEKIKDRVERITDKIKSLRHLYVRTRGAGHTEAIKRAINGEADCILLAGTYETARNILKDTRKQETQFSTGGDMKVEIASWKSIDKTNMYGKSRPVIIDNSAVTAILNDSLRAIDLLTRKNESLEAKNKALRSKFKETKKQNEILYNSMRTLSAQVDQLENQVDILKKHIEKL